MSTRALRPFNRYKVRFIPLAAMLMMLGPLAIAILLGQGTPIGLALAAAFAWLLLDRGILLGNRWLRRRVAERVEALGERVPQGARFVGLAHPCFADHLGRRMLETDDDVGYLSVSAHGLQYRGDGLSFDVPASDITSVKLVRSWYAPWARVEVQIADGEPFESIILDSRNHSGHTACRGDNRALYAQIRQLVTGRPTPERVRLTGQEHLGVTIDARS